jgi:hypothetical protein
MVLSEFVFDAMDQAGLFLCGLQSRPLTPALSRGRGSRFGVLSEFVFDTMDQAGLFCAG